jgi:tRNA pseudouridine38-40 synthase
VSLLLRVAYDGSKYHGFARQIGQETIQGELERALSHLYRSPIEVRGASRTDAGVHAQGQLVAIEAPLSIPPEGVVSALRGLLPRDISVWSAWQEDTPEDGPLHPRFCNGGKHYRYQIRTTPNRDPFGDRFVWHCDREMDAEAMQAGANYFVGEHDFAAFRAVDCQAKTTVRRLQRVDVVRCPAPIRYPADGSEMPMVTIDVHGEAFLKNMVRVMVGSLFEVGRGKRPPSWIAELLHAKQRARAGATAPASGLTLIEVKWPRVRE